MLQHKQQAVIFDNVGVEFGEQTVLRAINLRLTEQRIGIIGANGSGKTTLMRLINGLAEPTSGQISVDGLELPRHSAAVRRKVGFIFQNPDMQILMPTVAEDIAFGLQNLRLPKAEIAAKTQKIMADYGLIALANRHTHTLSGGQKQLLALCGALVMQPDILVIDEPTTQLDLRHKTRIMHTLQNLPQRIIMTTHDLPLLAHFNRVLVVDNGQIVCDASPAIACAFYEKLITAQP